MSNFCVPKLVCCLNRFRILSRFHIFQREHWSRIIYLLVFLSVLQKKNMRVPSQALCVIFTILVSFLCDKCTQARFASRAKINVFWNFFRTEHSQTGQWREEKFQKTLILAFEVIVQPPKQHAFEIALFLITISTTL